MKQENVTDLIMIENENVAVTKPYGNVASSVASGTVIPSGHQGFRKKSKNKNVNVNQQFIIPTQQHVTNTFHTPSKSYVSISKMNDIL